jgi:exodeoxyribonuclease-5
MYFAGIQLPSIHQNQHKMDETRPFIDPLYLTLDQQKLSLALGQFFESDVPVFLLKGYAGTGKTYLIGKLVEKLREMKRNVVLMAPTGRAA